MGCVLVLTAALTLATGNWEPGVRTGLDELIARNAGNGSAYAVFDFDNTTAIGDISNVCQWRMLETLAFKCDVGKILKTGIPPRYHARVDRIAALVAELRPIEESSRIETPAWRELANAYWTLYRDLVAECGTDVAYPWICYAFTGYTSEEIRTFARAAARRQLSRGTGLSVPSCGPSQYYCGFAITPEARDLFRALREAGIAVYVVSASGWELVQAMLDPEFGLTVRPENAYGYRMKKDAAGRYLPQRDESFPHPQAAGKVETIRRYIAPLHGGADPVLTAGDSMGDYDMMTAFPRLQAALVYNRNPKSGPLADLIRRAPESVSPRILVQGRDAAAGRLVPAPSHHVLVRDFRTVKGSEVVCFNVGTAAHGPATLAVLERHLPETKLSVWADAPLAPELRRLMDRRFPDVKVYVGPDVPETDAGLLLVSSGSSIAGSVQRSIGLWRRQAGRPVAAYAIGYGSSLKPLTKSFSFCFFRDRTALAKAEAERATPAVTGFAPDAVFDFDASDEPGTDAFLKAHGLERGKFVCAIPGERCTARWTYFGGRPNEKKAAKNAAHELSDNAVVCAAVVEAVRKHGMKVLLCAEQRSEMPLIGRALLSQLPDDVKAQCVSLKEFWPPDLALGVYRRSRCVFGIEMHSQVMAIGSGVPAVVMRHSGFGSKSDMMRDVGLGDWLMDIDEPDAAGRAAKVVGGILSDEPAARAKLAAARAVIDRETAAAFGRLAGPERESAGADDAEKIRWRPGHYQVHFIFTGRGESMFHIFPDGTSMLLDVGDSMRFYGTPKETPHLPDLSRRSGEWVARYVERVNPKGRKVDYFHLSHYHEDHGGGERWHGEKISAPTGDYWCSGLGDAARFLEFGRVVDRAWPTFDDPVDALADTRDGTSRNMKAVYAALAAKGTHVERFRLGARDQFRQLDTGRARPDFEVFNLCANGRYVRKDGSVRDLFAHLVAKGGKGFSENTMSCGMIVRYGKFRYFSVGDFSGRVTLPDGRTVQIENELAEAVGPVDVAKMSHHGHHSMYEELVKALRPRVWTSCVLDQAHCTVDTMKRLSDRTLYAGPRTFVPTYMPQRGREPTDSAVYLPDVVPAVVKEPCHVILDVPEGGETYTFTCVAAASETPRITDTLHFAVRSAAAPVRYEDFGAVGDGRHDDRSAIVAAHAAANAGGTPVRAKDGATYLSRR